MARQLGEQGKIRVVLHRLRRLMVVVLDGTLVPGPGSEIRSERAVGERTLYREIAQIRRNDAGIARAASQWGLLVRLPPAMEVITKQLAAFFDARRDEWLANARSPRATDRTPDPLYQGVARSTEQALETEVERVRREYEFSDADVTALQQGVATAGFDSRRSFVRAATKTMRSMRRRYPTSGPLPRWVTDLDASGDVRAAAGRLYDAVMAVGNATTPGETSVAVDSLIALRPPMRATAPDDDELNAVLGPLVEVIEQVLTGEPPNEDGTDGVDIAPGRAVAAGLLAYWKAGDVPVGGSRADTQVPRLADPDTWRTILVFASTLPRPQHGRAWLKPERAKEWRDFSIECALWRNVIDALARIEAEGASPQADTLRAALAALASRLGPRLNLPVADLAKCDPTEPTLVRERLLRWVAARCALGGLDPRPRDAVLGTEGRALLSIEVALSDATPRRPCAWPDCRELLPPRSYAHRQFCDVHLRKRAAERTARRRAARHLAGQK